MLTLIRDIRTETAIMGRLYLNGHMVCYTLENAVKAIPCELYTVQNSRSPKFKRELPLVYNGSVPASRGIRLHVGNTVASSSGCILVGMGRSTEDFSVTESKLAEIMVTMLCRGVSQLIVTNEHG